jgi:hypothetical protein
MVERMRRAPCYCGWRSGVPGAVAAAVLADLVGSALFFQPTERSEAQGTPDVIGFPSRFRLSSTAAEVRRWRGNGRNDGVAFWKFDGSRFPCQPDNFRNR